MKPTIIFIAAMAVLSACSMKQEKTEQVLTIDSTLQAKVTSILENMLREFDAQSGQVIVMEVPTGQIRALAGLERKDSASYQVTGGFCIPQPTGLFKTISLLAMLESGKLHLSDKVNTGNGVLIIGQDTLYDHNYYRGGYGKITVLQGFANESDIATALCLQNVFPDDKDYYEQLYKMPVNKPDRIRGLHYEEDIYVDCNYINAAIGYHKSALVQTLAFYNAIANNGTMVKPMLYEDSTTVISPQIASKANIDSIKSALQYVVTDGLGKLAKSDNVQVAGKTGTIRQYDNSYIAEFCGYFPADNPQYSMIVSIHKDNLPVSGGAMAGSVFKEIAEYMADESYLQGADTTNMSKSANDIRFGDWKESDWLDNEYIRTLRKYLDDYNAGKVSNSDLDPYKEQIKGKFVVDDIEPYLLGGAFIRITFLDMPDRVFSAWIYSNVDEKKEVVESYEFRSIAIEEDRTDFTKEDILQAIKEMDGLKLW